MEVEHEDQRIIAPRDFDGPVKVKPARYNSFLLPLARPVGVAVFPVPAAALGAGWAGIGVW